jgi:hypothetical protein
LVIPGYLAGGWAAIGIVGIGADDREEMAVHFFERDGRHGTEVTTVPGMASYRTPMASGSDPLSPRAVFAVHGEEIYVAETLIPRIRVFDSTGSLQRELTWIPETTLSPDLALEEVGDLIRARAEPERASLMLERADAFPVRDRVSDFWGFLVDERGFLWVRPYDIVQHALPSFAASVAGPGHGGEWLILSPEGVEVSRVQLPDALEPTQITEDVVVGIHRDELGVESVQVHRLVRH